MSEENKVIKAGIGYTIGNYLLKGLSFLTVPLFSRLLDTSDYGILIRISLIRALCSCWWGLHCIPV